MSFNFRCAQVGMHVIHIVLSGNSHLIWCFMCSVSHKMCVFIYYTNFNIYLCKFKVRSINVSSCKVKKAYLCIMSIIKV